jgi:hypothetical protein
MNELDKTKKLIDFINRLKDAGFKVYAPAKISTYCNFVKDDKIGYVEVNDWGSFNFSTVHKPCHECGSGYSMYREVYPEIKIAYDCFVLAPQWANSSDVKAIKKYKNWADYTSDPINKIIPTVEY